MKKITKKIAEEYLLLKKYDDSDAAYNFYYEHKEYFIIENLFIKYLGSVIYNDKRDDRVCYFINNKYLINQAKYLGGYIMVIEIDDSNDPADGYDEYFTWCPEPTKINDNLRKVIIDNPDKLLKIIINHDGVKDIIVCPDEFE